MCACGDNPKDSSPPPPPPAPPGVQEDAVLVHPSNPKDFTLTVPRFEVKPTEVVAIVGRVGSGKSSIFQVSWVIISVPQ